MGSRSSKRGGNQRAGQAPGGKQASKAGDGEDALIEAAERLQATEPAPEPADGAEPVEGPVEEPATGAEVTGPATADRLRRAIAQAEAARKRAEARQSALGKKQEKLDADSARLAEARAEHQRQTAELQRRKDEIDAEERRLAERQEELAGLEEEARRGFAGHRQEQLAALRRELEERRAAFDEEQRELEDRHAARYAEREAALIARGAELDERATDLDRKELEQRRLERRLGVRAEHLDQEADDRVRERLARLETDLELERQNSLGHRRQLDAMRGLAEQRAAELARYETAAAELGGRRAPELAEELRRLHDENRELRMAAAANPVQDRARVEELKAAHHDLMVEREELLRQNAELRRHVTASMISATERENARMINQALQRQNDTLTSEIDQQSARLKQMQAMVKDSPPFPACTAMDDEERYGFRPELDDEPVRLRDFVERVRGRMALDLRLYYSGADLRCFVAGLASSRLHLLQGISGIGKTRLPEAFAQVIGAGRETVAVAAEWRSPQDLLGYYNAFERKFYESEFTQSLYKAQLPLFREKPFIVVLDEMNLSHPEQYFSDLLSAMERKEGDPGAPALLPLMTAPVSPAPRLLREGRALELPGNVWFIGTANNDETTVRFADKTYDRAHVLELPPRPRVFDPGETRPLAPVSRKALTDAFDAAEARHGGETDKVLSFLDGSLGERLRDGFGVSWGNRLERQAKRFVPVTVAAGGRTGEAADHLLATKVLRKLIGRVEIAPGDLQRLHKDIEALWGPAFPGTTAAKSLRVLDGEIRSLGLG
ncbi:AAA family ATPase [Actinomadura litoris]|uniref:AAA family ATPase n=1 Tax=Actinomadura litoris TaxID=2678616 RepID=UPI001FA7419D|nr:AAA family ATPase [Actinomadura litoris]